MTEVGSAYLSILPSAKGFGSKLSREVGGPVAAEGKRSGGVFGNAFAVGSVARLGKLRILAFGAVGALGGLAAMGAKAGLSTAAGMEQAQIAFTTMLGSASKAQSFIKQLQQFAAATPFDFPGLQSAASSLISVGINASDVIPIMTTLGNVTSGMGTGAEGVQRATIALQQMTAAQRISGEDLNQLRDAGIPVYDLLAAATGKTKAQVVALAQAGKLGSKELGQMMNALKTGKGLERFSGLMQKQSQSLTGLWSTFKDTVNMTLANLVSPAIPAIKSALGWVSNLITAWAPRVVSGFSAAGRFLGDIITRLRGPVSAVIQHLAPIIASVATGLRQFFSGFREGVDVGAPAMAVFGDKVYRVAQVLKTVAGSIGSGVIAAFRGIGRVVSVFLGALRGNSEVNEFEGGLKRVNNAGIILGDFLRSRVIPALQALGRFVMGTVVPALQRVGSFIAANFVPALSAIGGFLWGKVIPAIVSFGRNLIATVWPILLRVGSFLAAQFGPVFRAIGDLIVTRIWPALQGLWARFLQILPTLQTLGRFLMQVGRILGIVIGVIAAAVIWIGTRLIVVILKLAGPIFTFLFAAIGKIIGIIAWLVRVIISIITAVVRVIVAIVRFVVDAVKWWWRFNQGVASAIQGALEWVSGLPGKVIGFLKDLGVKLLTLAYTSFMKLKDGASNAWDIVVSWVKGIPQGILDAVGDLANTLYNAGVALLDGLLRGLKDKWRDVTGFVGGIGGWIADHKGPISYDRTLLVPHGRAILGGLMTGLRSQMPALASTLASITTSIPATVGVAMTGVAPAAASGGVTYNVELNNPPQATGEGQIVGALNRVHALHGVPQLAGV